MLLDHDTKTALGTLLFLASTCIAAYIMQRRASRNTNRFIKYKGVKNAYNGK